MARGLQVIVAVIPPDSPGQSIRVSYDPDITHGILAYEISRAAAKLLKKINKKPKEPTT